MRIRTYSELRRLESFEERYEYLQLRGIVGESTFGFERHMNQGFYRSSEWRRARQIVIARDLGNDLGIEGYEIHDKVIVHHMNPMRSDDIEHGNDDILNPDYLITTTHQTHNAIHYGDRSLLRQPLVVRQRGDTKLW